MVDWSESLLLLGEGYDLLVRFVDAALFVVDVSVLIPVGPAMMGSRTALRSL
jgi:hypothetical protein